MQNWWFFVRSGYADLRVGFLRGAGIDGFDWSSAAAAFSSATPASAYTLRFYASVLSPSNGPYNRWAGSPVRCLASGA